MERRGRAGREPKRAAAISVDTAAAADLAVRGLEEYSLLFSSVRPVPTE